MGKTSIQLFSVRQYTEKDLLGTIRKLADLGYGAIQYAGFFGTPAGQLKDVLVETGIQNGGAHVGIDQLLDGKFEQTLDYHQEIGNNLVICPWIPDEMRNSADDFKRTAETLNLIGEKFKKHGVIFGYHNHSFEFKQFDGKTGFDILFANADPELVKVELDCYWAQYAGFDPYDLIEKYKDRIISLHLKDLKMVEGKKTTTEIGTGILNMKKLIEQGERYGVQWFTVEQEDYERDPMESAKINVENLRKLMK